MHRTRRVAALLLAAFTLSAAIPTIALATGTVTISGATASFPLVSLLVQKYEKLNKKVRFKISQGGTQVGINNVAAGRDSVADVSRDPLPSDPAGLVFYPIAKYYLCVVTNSANKLPNLTQAQAESIFTGKTREWSKVPGATASGPIDLISRNSTAGTLSNFSTLLIGGKKVSSLASEAPSEGLQRQSIEKDPNSIGFLSGYFASKGVNDVGFNGVGCTLANANGGSYAGVARFYEVTKGVATGAASAFIGWVKASNAAQKIISTQWISLK
ncbi:MAG TPA: substrate-binding domain-containing protein [Solirubrobacteraceae bacterium]|jgi:phosphate transport system substrate-binding protein|nr:substrate-binding domain-containing protein [Solirubrobacteraceae bacterium]